ncbi:MAG TPA: diguanylate cyclase [Roseiflexaceae bacterium]|nr:diguanylate cyclase [Roseiflexaceae bacterium]
MAASNDPLDGLPNRLVLNGALKQAIDARNTIAVALLDIDSFAEINADFGQAAGDRVLRVLVALLKEAAPASVYHLSGDEFAIVLPGLSLEQAFLRMEALRATVEASERFDLPDQRNVMITIGVAQYPRDAKDARSLLQAADAALATAKESGRNQVALPPNEEMVMKSCYYPASSMRKLRALAERLGRKDSPLLREALDDLFRKYDVP